MAFRPSDVIGLIWHHPIVSGVVLLLFTPPLFPIMVYFSPLLISTALFVLAMISMGSDHEDTANSYNNDIPFKRVSIEEVDVDGPSLDGERVPKRLKASSKDESWFDKVKNWEGTGRAWVESVLTQEARKSFSSNDSASSRDESIPLLDKAREFFLEDVRKRSPEPEYVPKTSSRPIDGQQTAVSTKDSAPNVPVENSEAVDYSPRSVPVDGSKSLSEVTPDLESEDELIEIAPANIPPSPLFRSKSLPNANATVSIPTDAWKTNNTPSAVPPLAVESIRSLPGKDSEDGKNTSSRLVSTDESSIPPVVEAKLVKRVPADVENSMNSAGVSSPRDVPVTDGSDVSSDLTDPSAGGEVKPNIKPVSSGVISTEGTDRNLADKSLTSSTTDSNSKSGGTSTKSAAELLTPLRQGQQASYGLGTPSAAVALSEKLKVPLADIMSLLAGEDKENASNEGPAGVKVLSSETTTTSSQEEDWSNSDVESPVPHASVPVPSSPEKDV